MAARLASARRGAGTVRIIGGKWKGRKLRVAAGVRPTPDRARETLFNWLATDLLDARVLDLFAGTGVLGFEALSRGAGHATLVEQDRRVANLLRRSRELLAADATVVYADAMRWLANCGEDRRWDVILLDPPFASERWPRILELAVAHLSDGGCVYMESDARLDQTAAGANAGLAPLRRSSAGSVRYGLFGRESRVS